MAALIRLATPLLAIATVAAGANAQERSVPIPSSPSIEQWRPIIAEASRRFGVPQAWISAVMNAESRGHTRLGGAPIVSGAGAMGLMQLMPGTWAAMRDAHGLGNDPHDPRDNIMAGTAYLRAMYDQFGYPGLFAAYNAGPARYAEHLRTGNRLPAETRGYMAQITGTPAGRSMPPLFLSGSRLFFALGSMPNSTVDESKNEPSDDRIAPLLLPSKEPK